MTIRLATISDTLSIIKIWRECFTEDTLFIENFISHCFPYTKTWILTPSDSETPVAVLSLLPSYTKYKNRIFNGGYVYGVATMPDFRGRSYSGALMERAIQYSVEEELHYIVVKPATDSLFDLYKKQSFDTIISKSLTQIDISQQIDINSCSHKEREYPDCSLVSVGEKIITDYNLYSIREDELSNSHLLWPKEILTYTIKDALLKGGDIVIITNMKSTDRVIYFIYYPIDDLGEIIKVVECNAKSTKEIYHFTNYIKSSCFSAKTIIIEGHLDGYTGLNFTIERSALIKKLKKGDPLKYLDNLHLALPME